jgi:hypothetical protein
MTASEQLASRLQEVILNGTWIANTNFKAQIEHLDWKVATKKTQSLNTISLICQHVHYYIVGIINVYEHGKLEIKDQFSFEFPPIESQIAWEIFQEKFWRDTEYLAELIKNMPNEQLYEPFADPKYGNFLRNINGIIEHSYYHLGQVVLIQKLA